MIVGATTPIVIASDEVLGAIQEANEAHALVDLAHANIPEDVGHVPRTNDAVPLLDEVPTHVGGIRPPLSACRTVLEDVDMPEVKV